MWGKNTQRNTTVIRNVRLNSTWLRSHQFCLLAESHFLVGLGISLVCAAADGGAPAVVAASAGASFGAPESSGTSVVSRKFGNVSHGLGRSNFRYSCAISTGSTTTRCTSSSYRTWGNKKNGLHDNRAEPTNQSINRSNEKHSFNQSINLSIDKHVRTST